MSKKERRIKDLERTLRASVARNAIVARENRELWAAHEAVRVERDEWQRQYDERGEYVAYLEGQADDLIATVRHVEGQVDSLSRDLGECQAGREALQRKNTVLARQREQWQSTAVKRLREIRDWQSKLEIAHRWKTYATSIESQIEILQTAIDERDERLDNIKFFLSDGDE